jgi:hypothetical protein
MSVLELSVFLQPKHGAFNNGYPRRFRRLRSLPLQPGLRLPLIPLSIDVIAF